MTQSISFEGVQSLKKDRVLVLGSGGREHALVWKLSQSPLIEQVWIYPGNAGMDAGLKDRYPRLDFSGSTDSKSSTDWSAFAQAAKKAGIDFVVVGPDNPLSEGVVDACAKVGLKAFGPTQAAARIESSKTFAKEVMTGARVPTARFSSFESLTEAHRFLDRVHGSETWSGFVVKADGLALGKGVRVCESLEEAKLACQDLIALSGKVLIEERLFGEEISLFALCDGETAVCLEPARDYKRVHNKNQGPNTGGMGAFSPVPGFTDANFSSQILNEVVLPVLAEMKAMDCPFQGLLYVGLMVNKAESRYGVLEFNARFGDPETQALLPRIDEDLYPWLKACTSSLKALPPKIRFKKESSVFVVAASPGYPEKPKTGQLLSGDFDPSRTEFPAFFFSGVRSLGSSADLGSKELVASGGRVFGALGLGESLELARKEAYRNLSHLRFEGMHFRTDIAEQRGLL